MKFCVCLLNKLHPELRCNLFSSSDCSAHCRFAQAQPAAHLGSVHSQEPDRPEGRQALGSHLLAVFSGRCDSALLQIE